MKLLLASLVLAAFSTSARADFVEVRRCRLADAIDAPIYTLSVDIATRACLITKSGSEMGKYPVRTLSSGPVSTYEFTDEYGTFWFIIALDNGNELRKVTGPNQSRLISRMNCENL